MYKFSAPMPYTIEDINKLLDINNQVQKSKITSLYACVPRGCEVFTGFEQSRNFAFDNVSWNYWKSLIEYTFSKGCDFVYLLNSPKSIDIESNDFLHQFEKLELLLLELRKISVHKIRVASSQLMSYIGKYYPDFNVLASTSLEYKTISEYQNFIHFHPEVKQIVPSHDVNKNFLLLKNLVKRYPNMEFELMVNEGCLQGCPNRLLHETSCYSAKNIQNNNLLNSPFYCTYYCRQVVMKYPIHSLVIGTNIFPWDIDEYRKIGINKFKLVGRDVYSLNFNLYVHYFKTYLKGIDSVKSIENYPISDLIHHINSNAYLHKLKIKEYKRYLPKINHFKKFGHLCSSNCGITCKYCYNCAEKIQKISELKTKKKFYFVSACEI